MSTSRIDERLSHISTNWDQLRAAHDDEQFDQEAHLLRGELLHRYSGCIYQYILGATKSHHSAEDLTQEFALRFVRGDFRNANPDHGRFRDYLKAALRNLITDSFRVKASTEGSQSMERIYSQATDIDSLESRFAEQWRQRVLSITWAALKHFEDAKQTLYFSVLHLRAENPDARSDQLAAMFSSQQGKTVTADWIRQTLRRARLKFAELLIEEVGKTVQTTDRQEIRDELADLGLRQYVDME